MINLISVKSDLKKVLQFKDQSSTGNVPVFLLNDSLAHFISVNMKILSFTYYNCLITDQLIREKIII